MKALAPNLLTVIALAFGATQASAEEQTLSSFQCALVEPATDAAPGLLDPAGVLHVMASMDDLVAVSLGETVSVEVIMQLRETALLAPSLIANTGFTLASAAGGFLLTGDFEDAAFSVTLTSAPSQATITVGDEQFVASCQSLLGE